ncbi:MAG TPA: hypothetical protein VIP27_02310, partial [Variovorax sp.]
ESITTTRRPTNKARHTLIHSRPTQGRLPPLAHDSIGAVAHFYFGADSSAVGQSIAPGMCTSTTTALVFFPFNVEPRVPPTGVSTSGAAYLLTALGSATGSISAFTYSTASTSMATCIATVSGLVAGNATMLSANSSATLFLFTGCEL